MNFIIGIKKLFLLKIYPLHIKRMNPLINRLYNSKNKNKNINIETDSSVKIIKENYKNKYENKINKNIRPKLKLRRILIFIYI